MCFIQGGESRLQGPVRIQGKKRSHCGAVRTARTRRSVPTNAQTRQKQRSGSPVVASTHRFEVVHVVVGDFVVHVVLLRAKGVEREKKAR